MNAKILSTTLLLATLSANVFADYQVEAYGSYEHISRDAGDDSGLTIGGEYYFKPVSTEGIVLGEAAFLNKASYVNLEINSASSEETRDVYGWYGNWVETKQVRETALALGGRYVAPENNIIIEAGFESGDDRTFSIAGGAYVNDKTEVLIALEDNKLSGNKFYVKGKTMLAASNGQEIGVSGRIGAYDGDTFLEASGELFLSRMMSVGANAGALFLDKTIFSLTGTGEYFVSEQLAFNAELGFADVSETDLFIGLGVKGRF